MGEITSLHFGDGAYIYNPNTKETCYFLLAEFKSMEWIGLLDKNGKEVYDSDVLKSYEGILWRVQWNEEKAEFELAWCGGRQPVYYRHGLHLIKDTHCEVIGNVYENPELLPAHRQEAR